MKIKCLNLISLVNETKFLYQHESRQHKYRLNKSVCNSKQKWNHNEFRCKNVKKIDDWASRKKDYVWNSSKRGC